jgi:glycosidase
MYHKMLKKILADHPLYGIEVIKKTLGNQSGLKPPSWIHEGPLYEIFVRNFSSPGTFNGVREQLPYLKDLGIKTIWLMPIHPIGFKKRKGSMGSPYAIRDLYGVEEALGSKEDFKDLVEAVHHQDMRIILDLVVNQTAPDHPWTSTHPQFYPVLDDKKKSRLHPDWTDIVELEYDNIELRRNVRDVIRYWVNEFNVDGYRCDVAGLVPLDLWEDVSADLYQVKKDFFLLAEWESARFHLNAFHATYDWSNYFVLADIFKGKRPADDILTWGIEKEAHFPRNSLPLRFTENHDFQRTRKIFGTDSFFPYVVYNFTMYGIPLIYCGQEIGFEQMTPLFKKKTIDWNQKDEKIFDFYQKLILLRKKHPALSSRTMEVIPNNQPSEIISYVKKEGKEQILVVLNLSKKTTEVTLDLPEKYIKQHFTDLFNDHQSISGHNLQSLKMEPYGYYLLKGD